MDFNPYLKSTLTDKEITQLMLDMEYENYLTEMYNLKTGNLSHKDYLFSEIKMWKMTEQEDGDYVV